MRQNIEKIAKNCEKWNQDPPINPPTPLLKIVWRFIPPSNSPPYFALGGLTSTSSTATRRFPSSTDPLGSGV